MTTKLTVLGSPATLEKHLGQGTTGEVFLAQSTNGQALVLKFARNRATHHQLAEEGSRLLGVDSPWCVRLLGAGVLGNEIEVPGPTIRLAQGTPYLVMEHHPGAALNPAEPLEDGDRVQRALLVARDVGRALSDLHASGVAHGDVKPPNVLLYAGPAHHQAWLMDFGLSGPTRDAIPRGGTLRYLAPEVRQARDGDARLRDLFALGVTLAEVASAPIARSTQPLQPDLLDQLDPRIGRIVRALVSSAPATRPSADWVFRAAFAALSQQETAEESRARRQGVIRRTYIALRRSELIHAARSPRSEIRVAPPVRSWLEAALETARAIEHLRGRTPASEPTTLGELGDVARSRWLVSLAGPSAAAWPRLPSQHDGALAERLLSAVETLEPSCLTFGDLDRTSSSAPRAEMDDPVRLALALGRGSPPQALLDSCERYLQEHHGPSALAVALARALLLRGHLGRAGIVLEQTEGPEARIEHAEVWRRAGDLPSAEHLLDTLALEGLTASLEVAARSVRARIRLDTGDPRAALALLEPPPASSFAYEVRALAQIALGERRAAAGSVDLALLVAESDEERARALATAGNLAHQEGEAERALSAFRRAAEHAARAGAVLEEATYLTGVAAEATQVGELGEAIAAGRRAMLLFEALGRPRDAARAMLSLASVHVSIGALVEARDYALAAAQRARVSGDRRCQAYSHLVLCDAASDNQAIEHAQLANSLLEDPDDNLRASARLHEHGAALDLESLDRQAIDSDRALDARVEWWTARARIAATSATPFAVPRVIEALLGFAEAGAPALIRGPACAAGAELAARTGQGDEVRRLMRAAANAARELLARAGPDLGGSIRLLPWVRAADAAAQTGPFSAEQLQDVERLLRALGRRDRLRPLLEQVADALVLWTGVERGLLLLRAPGGKLKPRVARNLSRKDLSGAQLELSSSLAVRALALGEPVVAVDASGELPDVHESVHALKLRSVLAVPLIARGEALGVVYLDDRVRRGAFGPRELSWVRLIATLAAVAIADARDQILLRRALRRARRAEARLGLELAHREAALDVAERELARASGSRETRFSYDAIVGQSEALRSMLRLVDRVASSDVPVLLIGESGSGKELVARAIHQHGARSTQAFVAENCGSIPETLLESTLFGHVRGAFTGAARARAGLFEVAHGGSLFLDEIGEMSLSMQAKLLRALQDGEIRPVGADTTRRVDVRVIGATHRDLDALVAEGRFREDLYYRLNVITVRVPSLRERTGDIPILVKHFLLRHAGNRRVQVSKTAMDRLCAFSWPGNVRQLENEIRRALVLTDGMIAPENLSDEVAMRSNARSIDELNLRQRVDALEVELVRLALRRTEGNQTRAAELLGVSRFGLQKMMKRLEISLESAS